jgi:F-type H+-transporting ATPase subunit beta
MATWNSSVKANREGAAEVNMEATSPNLGEVVSVRGSVVDIRFGTRLPPIYTLLRAGKDGEIAIEVLAQIDVHRVRGSR